MEKNLFKEESMDELYKEYGKLMVSKEILDQQINDCKKRMMLEMNKPQTPEPPKA